jgi:hypothetical protein
MGEEKAAAAEHVRRVIGTLLSVLEQTLQPFPFSSSTSRRRNQTKTNNQSNKTHIIDLRVKKRVWLIVICSCCSLLFLVLLPSFLSSDADVVITKHPHSFFFFTLPV